MLVELLLRALVALTLLPFSSGCTCLLQEVCETAQFAGLVLRGEIESKTLITVEDAFDDDYSYRVVVKQVFKGGEGFEAESIILTTPASSATCGVNLPETAEDYVFFIHGDKSSGYRIDSCSYPQLWSSLSEQDMAGLGGDCSSPLEEPDEDEPAEEPMPVEEDLECNNNHICTREYRPLCAEDVAGGAHKTFANECTFASENGCGDIVWTYISDGACEEAEQEAMPVEEDLECNRHLCTREYRPLCAEDAATGMHKTFGNECTFSSENGCGGIVWTFVSHGACKEPDQEPDQEPVPVEEDLECSRTCTEEHHPLCAEDAATGTYQTFSNECTFASENGCGDIVWTYVYDGECGEPEEDPCSKKTSKKKRKRCKRRRKKANEDGI